MSLTEKPGLVVSSTAHVALLLAAVLSFAGTPKFPNAQQTIPIELVSAKKLNQIMRGDKHAKHVQPKRRVDKVAKTRVIKPKPPLAEAKRDISPPPSPDKKRPDPGKAEKAVPKPKAAVSPPAPAKVAAKTPAPTKPKPASAVAHNPPPQQAADTPLPPPRPKFDTPKKTVKKPPPKLKLDEIAKLLKKNKLKDPHKAAKLKSGQDSHQRRNKFNLKDISRLLSHEAPQRRAASGRKLAELASLGAPSASARRMSPTLMAAMESWFENRFQNCWDQPITVPPGPKYVPEIRVPLNRDGSLAGPPTLINPPSNPAWRPLAESAMRAVRECNPLPVPAKFKPYYDEWKGRIVRFNDDSL